jgi:hypothetical protein
MKDVCSHEYFRGLPSLVIRAKELYLFRRRVDGKTGTIWIFIPYDRQDVATSVMVTEMKATVNIGQGAIVERGADGIIIQRNGNYFERFAIRVSDAAADPTLGIASDEMKTHEANK